MKRGRVLYEETGVCAHMAERIEERLSVVHGEGGHQDGLCVKIIVAIARYLGIRSEFNVQAVLGESVSQAVFGRCTEKCIKSRK